MKKEVMEKWVKALRSGKYKQGVCCLKDRNDKYCCLGVLCEISELNVFELKNPKDMEYRYNNQNSILSTNVRDWAGIKTLCGELGDNSLTGYNDAGRSFNDIADIIEQNWEKL